MDISQESDPKSQDEIPVRPSFGKNFECYVRERYLKKISVVGVYRAAIPSEKFRLIRRKGLLIPFVSISVFFCRSNWLTEVDLSNRKTAFHKPSTFSGALVPALVRTRASSYRFFDLSLSLHHGLIWRHNFSWQVAMWAPNLCRAYASKELAFKKQNVCQIPVRC